MVHPNPHGYDCPFMGAKLLAQVRPFLLGLYGTVLYGLVVHPNPHGCDCPWTGAKWVAQVRAFLRGLYSTVSYDPAPQGATCWRR